MQMWSRSYLHFGLFHLLANASSEKDGGRVCTEKHFKNHEETVLAPNGQCIVWTGCISKGRGECLYGKIYVKCLHGDSYKWQVFRVHRLARILQVRAEIPENMHCSHRCPGLDIKLLYPQARGASRF